MPPTPRYFPHFHWGQTASINAERTCAGDVSFETPAPEWDGVLSERAHAAEDALYKLGGLFSNLDERRGSETRELHSNIESLENVVEVKREQLSALEKDVDEE
ncbi:hypothetical protein FOZ63_022536, partial [Perkinsus olseni]